MISRYCAVSLEGVTVRLGPNVALNDISVAFRHGLTLLLGPNGSGKTTLLRVIAGLITPDKGKVSVCGNPPSNSLVSGSIGDEEIPSWLSVKDYLAHMMKLVGCDKVEQCGELFKKAFFKLGIKTFEKLRGSQLSSGMKRKVIIVLSLMRSTPVLLLDEPFANLDRKSIDIVSELISQASENRTVIVATHIRPKSLAADMVVELESGEIVKN
ncbi:MAG: ABC transporter ATP-binding protein [Desulfurococcales archaeon]|nr:ABC transporter ATP-binding protein [Desulfurococcales archaeon]